MSGSRVSAELMLKLIGRLDNFAGLVDASLDWQFMLDLVMEARHARPGFLLISGTELMVSAAAIGATGMFAPLAGVAPNLLRALFELCRDDKLFEARAAQEEIARLRQLLKAGGVASLKAALALDRHAADALARHLDSIAALRDEPRGW
jgi:dihydrodipicolinate synthase/N-acetylneuraminate lyase